MRPTTPAADAQAASGGAGQPTRDEERWQEALDLARGAASSAARRRVRRRRTTWVLVVVLALVAAAAVGALVAALVGPTSTAAPNDGEGWRGAVDLGAGGLGLVMCLVGLVVAARRGQWGARWKAPTAALTVRQRRQVLRQVRGRAPVTTEHLPVLRDTASRLAAQGWALLIVGGIVVEQTGRVVGQPDTLTLAVAAFVLVLLGVGGALVLRDRRCAERFLDRWGAR